MVIFLAHFKIKPDKVSDFFEFWRKVITIEDRTDMIGEFLCEVKSKEDLKYITWTGLSSSAIGTSNEGYKSFLHVSMWKSVEAFESQVAHHFNDTAPLRPFEQERRVRTMTQPRLWRMGDTALPLHDSGGVL